METEWVYRGIWITQSLWALVILLRDAYRRDSWKIMGLIAGLIFGVAPLAHVFLPMGTFKIDYFGAHFLYVPLALTLLYGLRRRWVPFIVALAFSVGPFAYTVLTNKLATRPTPTGEPFGTFLSIYIEFEPILAALIGHELGAWYGDRVKKLQEKVA